jgi:Arc/MetJ family transcription regulator
MMHKHLDITFARGYDAIMRTTLTIDDDVLAAARSLARAKSESLGRAVSELVRRGLNETPRVRGGRRGSGFPVFSIPRGAHPISLEDVRQAEDDR